jgi:hypothetical protein
MSVGPIFGGRACVACETGVALAGVGSWFAGAVGAIKAIMYIGTRRRGCFES